MAALLLTTMAGTASARSWRINSHAARKAHFLDINAACSSEDVVDGDTLYLDPGCDITSIQTLSKRLTLIGTGTSGQAHQAAILSQRLYVTAAGAKVEGLYLTGGDLCPQANDIVVERCYVNCNLHTNGTTAQSVTIRQCQINGQILGIGATDTRTQGWTIENCLVFSGSYEAIKQLYTPTIRNCYVRNTSSSTSASSYGYCLRNLGNAIITNNIILNKNLDRNYANLTNCTMTNNVISRAEDTEFPDNTFLNSDYTDAEPLIFTFEGNEQDYRLKDGSLAAGVGVEGEDCGPFAGAYPYVPYCRPYGIPYFTHATASSRPTDGKVSINHQVTIQKQ